MTLFQPLNGYCYNTDTFLLFDFISKFKIKGKVLEVGGGCGVLGLLLLRDFKIDLTFIEIQKVMADFIRENLRENNLQAEVLEGDFLEYNFEKRFDFIISNPPFYNGTLKSENEIIKKARYEEFLPMKNFFDKVNRTLSERGEFIFCYDAKRIDDIVKSLPNPLKITDLRFFYPRVTKNATLVLVRAKRHAKSEVKIHPPLIGFEGDNYSEELANIYKRANTKSIKVEN